MMKVYSIGDKTRFDEENAVRLLNSQVIDDNEYFDVSDVTGLPIVPVTAERSFIVDFKSGSPWWQQEDGRMSK